MSSDTKFFLAARRVNKEDGINLVLVDPWTGDRHFVRESQLREAYGIELGDFVHASVDPMKILYNISKTKHTGRIWTKVVGNIAVVENVLSELKSIQGQPVFQNKLFGDSVCNDKSLELGEYKIKINLLEEPLKLPTGRLIHFEATCPERKPQNNLVVGTGFPVAPKRESKVVGEGFSVSQKKRAVVLSRIDKPVGTHYYLWVLDLKVESLFVSKSHDLGLGHFFDGLFIKKGERYICESYGEPIVPMFTGGINPNGKVYFTVPIDQFQPSVDGKPAFAMAKYFGEVLEGDTYKTKLSPECNGKMVNIQRRGIGAKQFVWMVTEILNES
uniref:DUF3616 domain-containing protein n=1 Tax=Caenorhabditis tropicalis TaxID=1561998 RepID=A0A1I7UM63_9PELO